MKKNEEKWGGEDVEAAVAAEVGGEFNALYLAAAEGASVLAEGEVAESHPVFCAKTVERVDQGRESQADEEPHGTAGYIY